MQKAKITMTLNFRMSCRLLQSLKKKNPGVNIFLLMFILMLQSNKFLIFSSDNMLFMTNGYSVMINDGLMMWVLSIRSRLVNNLALM